MNDIKKVIINCIALTLTLTLLYKFKKKIFFFLQLVWMFFISVEKFRVGAPPLRLL